MLPDKMTLLDQINTAIQKNSFKRDSGLVEGMSNSSMSDRLNPYTQSNFNSLSERAMMNKLEQRLEMLEGQNDRLLYFIHFLYKNFPELVRDILTTQACNATESTCQPIASENETLVNPEDPYLTRREVEILHLVVKGLAAKEIASQLFICESTVITHKKNLKEKFRAKNTAELIAKAFHISMQERNGADR